MLPSWDTACGRSGITKDTQRSQLLHTVKALAARQTALSPEARIRPKALSFTPIIQRGPGGSIPFLSCLTSWKIMSAWPCSARTGRAWPGVERQDACGARRNDPKQQYFIQALARRVFRGQLPDDERRGQYSAHDYAPVLDRVGTAFIFCCRLVSISNTRHWIPYWRRTEAMLCF